MTIYEIKQKTLGTQPHFFTRSSMRFFHQTLRDYKVYKETDGKYFITAPMKDNTGKCVGHTQRLFNPETNDLEFIPK